MPFPSTLGKQFLLTSSVSDKEFEYKLKFILNLKR
jgi:hypothetical protein